MNYSIGQKGLRQLVLLGSVGSWEIQIFLGLVLKLSLLKGLTILVEQRTVDHSVPSAVYIVLFV